MNERMNEILYRACIQPNFNPLTVGAAYIRVSIFYYHIKYRLLNMLKIKCEINQQYLKTVLLTSILSNLNNF